MEGIWRVQSVRVSRVCEDGFGFCDRRVSTLTPIRSVGRATFGRVGEDFEEPKQNLEVLGLALEALAELCGDRQRRHAVGLCVTRPDAGDIGLSGGFVIFLLVRPVVVFDGETTGGCEGGGFVAALPEDRQP